MAASLHGDDYRMTGEISFASFLPFPTVPRDPKLDSRAKVQRQRWKAKRRCVTLVQKIFDTRKKRHRRIDRISPAHINFLVTRVHVLVRQEQGRAKKRIAQKRTVVLS